MDPSSIGNPHYDDPSLALMFMQLKSRSLQTVKGALEISGRTEFNFVLQMARVFTRMGLFSPTVFLEDNHIDDYCTTLGCPALALDLVAHWSFDRVVAIPRPKNDDPSITDAILAPSPIISNRPNIGFMHGRQASLLIDMEIPPSLPATRPTSPHPTFPSMTPLSAAPIASNTGASKDPEKITSIDTGEADVQARRTGLGSLMKSAKKDVKVAEFDMDAFGF